MIYTYIYIWLTWLQTQFGLYFLLYIYYILYIIFYILYFILYIIYCILYIKYNILNIIYYILYIIYIIYYIIYILHYIIYILYKYILYMYAKQRPSRSWFSASQAFQSHRRPSRPAPGWPEFFREPEKEEMDFWIWWISCGYHGIIMGLSCEYQMNIMWNIMWIPSGNLT